MQNPKVLFLRLYGGNEAETRIRSVQLFRQFMVDNEIACPVTDFIDYRGYWVFCLVMFVTDEYIHGVYTKAWDKMMTEAGIAGLNDNIDRCESLVDFHVIVDAVAITFR